MDDIPPRSTTVECVVLDIDGVLIDSWRSIEASFVQACISMGIQHHGLVGTFKGSIGKPIRTIADEMGLPLGFVDVFDAVSMEKLELCSLFEGAESFLRALRTRGYKLAANTGRSRRKADALLHTFDLAEYFDAIVTSDDVDFGKPHPESLERVCADLCCRTTGALFVGDTVNDVMCAKNAGTHSMAATWGFGDAKELVELEPTYVAASLEEALRLIEAEQAV